jgi:Na+/phosphate symporter
MGEEPKQEENVNYLEKIKAIVEKELNQFSGTELNEEELDILYKLIDINKDIENIDYWNCKKEVMKMRYENYGDYSEGRYGNYGRRGVPGTGRGRYRGYSDGEEVLEDMKESYGAYSESMNAYSRGNYNAGNDGMKALEDTMELFTEFAQKMIQETDSPEAKQIIKRHLHRISQMG